MFNGKKMALQRKLNNFSQEQLANQLNVSISSIVAMYETNKRQPDNETIKNMAQLFSVSTDYLLDNDVSHDFIIETEDNMELLKSIANNLQDPLTKSLYKGILELTNNRDKKNILNILNSFMEDIDNN